MIGGLLVARASLDEVLAAGLVPEDFYVPSHANAFAAICSLALRGEPVDNLTVAGELRALGPAGPSAADLVRVDDERTSRFASPLICEAHPRARTVTRSRRGGPGAGRAGHEAGI